ncbi:MAG TPA: NAD(P)H-binding protein [Thermoanaerobaculia bacterium]|nr:NAD(P)H-binding protein [Thermoanaerobaculia bacterium]
MITIMGASGRTGKKIAENLLRHGEAVRALGRTESRLAELQQAGAEIRVGEAADAAFLASAFRGSDAVYTLLPTDRWSADCRATQDRHGEAIAKAVRGSGVRYVVALSSLGADLPEGTGLIAGLHAQEERLKRLPGVHILLLRSVLFFEEFSRYLPKIREEGYSEDSLAPDLAVPMVSVADVAEAACRALASRDWSGIEVRELLGPRDLSYADATLLLGERIGIFDLQYIQLPYTEVIQSLVRAGFSRSFAVQWVEMTRAYNEGKVKPAAGRTQRNTTPTRFEDFAAELARVYEAT